MRINLSGITILAATLFAAVAISAEPKKIAVEGQGFVADFYYTEGSPKKMGILLLGGSDGGKPDHLARLFAQEGYPVLALAYFKAQGTPEYLDMIGLEYFDKPIEWMKANDKIRPDGIVVIGGSKGAELALLLASKKPDIKGVIALSPTSVVWQGLPKDFWPPRSSWSVNGQPVPFVPYDVSKGYTELLVLYRQSLTHAQEVEKAAIEVEKINGAVLLLSGRDDKMWPSAEMGDAICSRLKEKGFKNKYEHVKYDDAGHTLNEYYMIGGTPEGNRKARLDSTKRMFEFLHALEGE